jgi:hypothetical protein
MTRGWRESLALHHLELSSINTSLALTGASPDKGPELTPAQLAVLVRKNAELARSGWNPHRDNCRYVRAIVGATCRSRAGLSTETAFRVANAHGCAARASPRRRPGSLPDQAFEANLFEKSHIAGVQLSRTDNRRRRRPRRTSRSSRLFRAGKRRRSRHSCTSRPVR